MRFPHYRSAKAALRVAVVASVATSAAFAEDRRVPDRANAIALFDEAVALENEGKLTQACPKYAESYRLDPKLGALLHTADCLERIGQIASAYAAFREAAELAANLGDSRVNVANERSGALLPKVPRLRIKVLSHDAGFELTNDGRAVAAAQWDTALPVDPGTVTIEARAPGKEAFTTKVTLAPDGKVVVIEVPPLKDAAAVSSTSAPVVQGPAKMGNDHPATTGSTQRALGWVTGGVGVLGLGAGTYFALKVNSKNNIADSTCSVGTQCSPADHVRYNEAVSDARSARTGAIVSFAVGGAAIIAGTVLIVTAPTAHFTALRITPVIDYGRLGVTMQGAF